MRPSEIVPMAEAHVAAVAALERCCFSAPWSEQSVREELSNPLSLWLVALLDGYFAQMAHHLNVNVMNRQMLEEAYEDPTKYPNLTIRVSGYAVNFHKLSREQQREVIRRTFHSAM